MTAGQCQLQAAKTGERSLLTGFREVEFLFEEVRYQSEHGQEGSNERDQDVEVTNVQHEDVGNGLGHFEAFELYRCQSGVKLYAPPFRLRP